MRPATRYATLAVAFAIAAVVSGCPKAETPAEGQEAAADKVAAEITGAGATFIYPLLSKWSDAYHKASGNKINYQSIGSGGGIGQIKAGTVDFGSWDKPLSPEELAQAGLGQFPSAIGGVVPVVNLQGHLVTMNDTNENHWVYTHFTAYGGVARALWIGLTDPRVPGAWEWVSGEPVTLTNYWISGQPNNAPTYGPQHWAMLWPVHDGVSLTDREKWNDYWDVTTTMDQYAFDLHGVVEVRPRSTNAALASGLYQTLPGATGEERGDRVPNGSRVVPLYATVTLDLRAAELSLTAMIANAVLERGDPFALTVRSSSGSQLPDGTSCMVLPFLAVRWEWELRRPQ